MKRPNTGQSQATPMLPLLIPSSPGEPGEEFPGLGRVRELSLAEARYMLSANPEKFSFTPVALTRMLKRVRVILWGDQLRPALYLEERTLAPYVRYFVRMEGECGIGRCPQCGTWFVQVRPDQIYDTVAHREAHRVTRWRAGKAKKKKSPLDTLFPLPRYNYRAKVLTRIPTIHPAHSYSHNRGPCSGG